MSWVWICTWENDASNWKDHERCRARSRKKYRNEKNAINAGKIHTRKTGHKVFIKNIGRKKW